MTAGDATDSRAMKASDLCPGHRRNVHLRLGSLGDESRVLHGGHQRGAQRVAADGRNVRRRGIELAERLRAEDQPMHLPVVVGFHIVVDVRNARDDACGR